MKKIQLGGHTKGSKIRGYALVDDTDFAYLNQWKWYLASGGYAAYDKQKENIKQHFWMHREIMKTPNGLLTDHINGDGLDNRRCNLRICTNQENLRNHPNFKNNTSGIAGISWDKTRNKWRASICVNYKTIHLGRFSSKKEAIKARKQAEIKYFGEFRHKP